MPLAHLAQEIATADSCGSFTRVNKEIPYKQAKLVELYELGRMARGQCDEWPTSAGHTAFIRGFREADRIREEEFYAKQQARSK